MFLPEILSVGVGIVQVIYLTKRRVVAGNTKQPALTFSFGLRSGYFNYSGVKGY